MGRSPIVNEVRKVHAERMNDLEHGVESTPQTETAPIATAAVSEESRRWAVFTHLSAFAMFLGIPSVVGPVVLWAVRKDEDGFVDFHGKEAVNFNLSFLLYGIASGILILALVGLVLLPVVFVIWFVLVIVATTKASAGEHYRYPLTIRFID